MLTIYKCQPDKKITSIITKKIFFTENEFYKNTQRKLKLINILLYTVIFRINRKIFEFTNVKLLIILCL